MKAAVVRAFDRPLAIEELPVPEPAGGQVLVRIQTCGLCHTDIHAARGEWPVKPSPPFIPGRETLPIFETVLGALDVHGSIVGTRHDLEEVFELHRRGLTRLEYEERRLEDVNLAIEQVLDGSAPAPRLVFRIGQGDTPALDHELAAIGA